MSGTGYNQRIAYNSAQKGGTLNIENYQTLSHSLHQTAENDCHKEVDEQN